MTSIVGENIDLQAEDFTSQKAVSEAAVSQVAQVAQWVRQNSSDYIGMIDYCALTEEQHATIKGYSLLDEALDPIPEAQKKWALLKGQDITGSDFEVLTGISNLPNLVANEAHLAQMKSDGSMLSYQSNQNKAHNHTVPVAYETSSATLGLVPLGTDHHDIVQQTSANKTGSEGGEVARPNRAMINIFLKINN